MGNKSRSRKWAESTDELVRVLASQATPSGGRIGEDGAESSGVALFSDWGYIANLPFII